MDLDLVCSEEMMPDTPAGVIQGPENLSEILQRRQLSCDLHFGSGPLARPDPDLLDPRVLDYMLKTEAVLQTQISPIIFSSTQDSVTPGMRCDTFCWMFEACEAEKYEEWVFLRACSYMDRILSLYTLLPNQLQLLGVVCLNISLKFHGIVGCLDKLLYYTANSVPKDLVTEWELMVMYGLHWDLSTIIPTDFIHLFSEMLPKLWFTPDIMSRVNTFVSFCATGAEFAACAKQWENSNNCRNKSRLVETRDRHSLIVIMTAIHKHTLVIYVIQIEGRLGVGRSQHTTPVDESFLLYTPSTIAIASLTVAISHMISQGSGEEILEELHKLTETDKDLVRSVMEKIQGKLASLCVPALQNEAENEESSCTPMEETDSCTLIELDDPSSTNNCIPIQLDNSTNNSCSLQMDGVKCIYQNAKVR